MAFDVAKAAQAVITLMGKGLALLEKGIPVGEKIVNAILPALPGIEKDLAAAIVAAADGEDIQAIEEAIVAIADIKSAVKAAQEAVKS